MLNGCKWSYGKGAQRACDSARTEIEPNLLNLAQHEHIHKPTVTSKNDSVVLFGIIIPSNRFQLILNRWCEWSKTFQVRKIHFQFLSLGWRVTASDRWLGSNSQSLSNEAAFARYFAPVLQKIKYLFSMGKGRFSLGDGIHRREKSFSENLVGVWHSKCGKLKNLLYTKARQQSGSFEMIRKILFLPFWLWAECWR